MLEQRRRDIHGNVSIGTGTAMGQAQEHPIVPFPSEAMATSHQDAQKPQFAFLHTYLVQRQHAQMQFEQRPLQGQY